MRTSPTRQLALLVGSIALWACGGGGGGGTTTTCPTGQITCGDRCVDPLIDRAHCGADAACQGGATCGAGEICSAGACATSCPPGQVICGDACIDPLTDRAHCGVDAACHGGTTCASGQVCAAGACATSCPTGQVDCQGKCVDPASDRIHCGADTACEVFTTCDSGQVCDARRCVTSCPAGQLPCDGRCVDPDSDPTYCGASASCTDGHACGAGSFCDHGACWSPCPVGRALCGGACVDPVTDRAFCGASGVCAGAASGVACRPDQLCAGGACVCPEGQAPCNGACTFGACSTPAPGFEWKASVPLTAPPHFVDPPAPAELVAHIVFDGTNMVDLTGHTHWTAVGVPGAVASGMWAPVQWASGPFSEAVYWKGDADAGAWLAQKTSGPFTVCARYKPGAHPGFAPNKIIVALGIPEENGTAPGTNLGGWALMQMHAAACFHHYSAFSSPDPLNPTTVVGGEWMKPADSALDSATLAQIEWVWQCGGFDGQQGLGSLGDAVTGPEQMRWGTNGSAVAPAAVFPSLLEPPAIGAYGDGSRPLYDGQVYEIIISTEPATDANMRNIVARAAGGLEVSKFPALLTGADGKLHVGSPATVDVQPDGSVIPEHDIVLGTHLPGGADPLAQGQCWALDVSAADWSKTYGIGNAILRWTSASGDQQTQLLWDGSQVYTVLDHVSANTGGNLGGLEAGSRHAIQVCFGADRKLRTYLDRQPLGSPTAALDPQFIPRTQDPSSTFALGPGSSHVRVWRVWGCVGDDPAACP